MCKETTRVSVPRVSDNWGFLKSARRAKILKRHFGESGFPNAEAFLSEEDVCLVQIWRICAAPIFWVVACGTWLGVKKE